MSSPEFPPLKFLGYGLDLTTVSSFDLTSISSAVIENRQIIQVDTDEDTRIIRIGDVQYKVPRIVSATENVDSVEGPFVTYPDGQEAGKAFHADTSLVGRYSAISGGTDVSDVISKVFRSDQQYAFYSFESTAYATSLRNYVDYLNERTLLQRLQELVTPFPVDPSPSVLHDYKAFFASVGSHAITGTGCGARYQFVVWASNSDEAVNKKFALDVQALFGGIPTADWFDGSVKQEAQYEGFLQLAQMTTSIHGGDQELAADLLNDPDNYEKYIQWMQSAEQNPAAIRFSTTGLWDLMRQAANSTIRGRANDVQNAFNYIVTHQFPHSTSVTLSFESNWAEFDLLSPSAMIIPNLAPLPPGALLNGTKVTFGEEEGHECKRATIKFLVINDGSPLDFNISHGGLTRDGSKSEAKVYIEGREYESLCDTKKKAFYHVLVSSRPAPSRFAVRGPSTRTRRTWNETLYDYLEDIHLKQDWTPMRFSGLESQEKEDTGAEPRASGSAEEAEA